MIQTVTTQGLNDGFTVTPIGLASLQTSPVPPPTSSIYFGSTNITAIYYGSTPVASLYYGSTPVFS